MTIPEFNLPMHKEFKVIFKDIDGVQYYDVAYSKAEAERISEKYKDKPLIFGIYECFSTGEILG